MTENSATLAYSTGDGSEAKLVELPFSLIVMGVSGAGKSTIAKELSSVMKVPFVEGVLLHPSMNIEKMSSGIALVDEDRWPWLHMIATTLREVDTSMVISCSALKRSYREYLRHHARRPIGFLYLEGRRETLRRRMETRETHFMKQSMLDTQLETLEPPIGEPLVFMQNLDLPVSGIIYQTIKWLEQQPLTPRLHR